MWNRRGSVGMTDTGQVGVRHSLVESWLDANKLPLGWRGAAQATVRLDRLVSFVTTASLKVTCGREGDDLGCVAGRHCFGHS
jgi:hypothetical protein